MNRSFKTSFHNGAPDEKPIVIMGVAVTNGKRFKCLDKNGRASLISTLESFSRQVKAFTDEIRDGRYSATSTKNNS